MPKANTVTIWVCVDCLLTRESDETLAPIHEPWSLLKGEDVSLGITQSEHANDSEDCVTNECECDFRHFDSRACDGCGSPLGGERHAYTLWYDDDESDESDIVEEEED